MESSNDNATNITKKVETNSITATSKVGRVFQLFIRKNQPSLSDFDVNDDDTSTDTTAEEIWIKNSTNDCADETNTESLDDEDGVNDTNDLNENVQCCETIDDSLFGLYMLPWETHSRPQWMDEIEFNDKLDEYDWILDGDIEEDVEQSRKHSIPEVNDDWGDFHSAVPPMSAFTIEEKEETDDATPFKFDYSNHMPDMSSPEGKFIRRVYKVSVEEDTMHEAQVEWEYYAKKEEYDFLPELLAGDDNVTSLLSKLDVIKSYVEKKRHAIASERFDDIVECRELQQKIDVDVIKAHLCATKAQNSLSQYTSFVDGECSVLQALENRDRYIIFQRVLLQIQKVLDLEDKLSFEDCSTSYVITQDVESMIQTAVQLKEEVGLVENLTCFSDLRSRSEKVMSNLSRDFLRKLENLMREALQHDLPFGEAEVEFHKLVEARSAIQSHLEEETGGDGVTESICTSILNSCMLEVERGLATVIFAAVSTEDSYDWEMYLIQIQSSTDTTSLRNISTALLVIQFALWEQSWHRIAYSLYFTCATILFVYTRLEELCQSHYTEIAAELLLIHPRLWNYIESTILFFLDQLIYLYKHTDAQSTSEWSNELHRMCILTQVIHSFQHMGKTFCPNREDVGELIYQKLHDIIKKFLRGIHVEAMNSIGSMLFQENWNIVEIDIPHEGDEYPSIYSIQSVIRQFIIDFSTADDMDDMKDLLPSGGSSSNPFLSQFITPTESNKSDEYKVNESQEALYSILHKFTQKKSKGVYSLFIGTNSSINGLLKWSSRLYKVMDKLCPICESDILSPSDVHVIFSDIYDLFFLTIFRLCAGSAQHEQMVLECKDDFMILRDQDINCIENFVERHTPNGRRRTNSYTRRSRHEKDKRYVETVLSPTTEADILSPTPEEYEEITPLRTYIKRAQNAIGCFVQLEKVEKWIQDIEQEVPKKHFTLKDTARAMEQRVVSGTSCLFAAIILDVVNSLVLDCCRDEDGDDETLSLQEFTASVVKMSPHLLSFSYRIATVRAIRGRRIIREILSIRQGWEDATLNNIANDYVELLCDGCAQLWGSIAMECPDTLKPIPSCIQILLWENIVTSSYLSLLHGFAQILSCSTEGRALMSMDLVTYASGIHSTSIVHRIKRLFHDCASAPSPPSIVADKGLAYVDIYVKVFYLNDEDIMKWIKENYGNYRLSHMLGLISAVSVKVRADEVYKRMKLVKDLYSTRFDLVLEN